MRTQYQYIPNKFQRTRDHFRNFIYTNIQVKFSYVLEFLSILQETPLKITNIL